MMNDTQINNMTGKKKMTKSRIISISSFIFSIVIISYVFYPQYVYSQVSIISVIFKTPPNVASSSSFLPVGSGARAMGMGGAFIAVADDVTAASWNPAGLIQLKRPQISVVGDLFIRHDSSTFDNYPEASVSHTTRKSHLNYLSFAYPIHLFRRNMVFSLNYQHLYDMDMRYRRRWHYKQIRDASENVINITWDYSKEGKLGAISPAFTIQVVEPLALGFTMNFWPKRIGSWENGWRKDFWISYQGVVNEDIPFHSIHQDKDHYTFSGINYHFGFLWRIGSIFRLGGVMKTSFSARLEHEYQIYKRDMLNHVVNYDYDEDMEKETLIMPPSYGLGLSARFSDSSTLSLDFYRTEWGKHKLEISEGTLSPVTEEPIGSVSVKSTNHIRLGFEYLKITPRTIIAFRSGLFYDPDPSGDNPDDFYGFSLGTGITIKQIDIDFAYSFRFARDISTISFQGETDRDDIDQHLLYLSAIYRL